MKKLFFLILILPVLFFSITMQAQTVDEIVDMHFDAVKQDLFNSVQTIIISSDISTPDGLIQQKIYYKRPDKMKIEEKKDGFTSIKSYDGNTGWFISPADSILNPELLTGRELRDIKFMANLDGYFFCYRNKGYKISYEGTENVSGKEAYKMKCKTTPDDSTFIFVDTKTYLFSKIIKPAINKATFISNYKKVNGIPFPYKFEIDQNGVKSTQVVRGIKLDVDLPDKEFQMPVK
ncbi:MAG TPA: hypothetical protein VKA26_07540 [Ignavibacteriaceae bacterium]|nr:hypothetical protein [Ignavibacteriaceae bacterium]